MVFTVFDIFMARSLRSLAGDFVWGVGEIWGRNHIFTTTLKYQKNSLTSTLQYCSIQSIRDIPRNTRYYLYLQYLQYSLVPGKFRVFAIFPCTWKFPVFII